MTRNQYRMRLALGWACFHTLMRLPLLPIKYRAVQWLISWAGFYAHDDGYENYCARVQQVADSSHAD